MLCTAGQQAAYARRVRSSFKPWNLRLHKATSADNSSLKNKYALHRRTVGGIV